MFADGGPTSERHWISLHYVGYTDDVLVTPWRHFM